MCSFSSQPEPQRSLVVTVCGRTGLNVKFAVDCLTQNEWDVEKAVAMLEGRGDPGQRALQEMRLQGGQLW